MNTDTAIDGSNELTAAAALTSLVTASPSGSSQKDWKLPVDDDETERDDVDEEEEEASGNGFLIPQKFTKSGRKRAIPFPLKLMKVLSAKEYHHIISWLPSGKSFLIHKPKVFTAEILPDHFKSAKYSSFTRKLHRWGFVRHYRGEEAGAFFHEDFQKDRIDLVDKMTCYKPSETTKAAAAVRKPVAVPVPKHNVKSQPSLLQGLYNQPSVPMNVLQPLLQPQQGNVHQSEIRSGIPLHIASALEELTVHQRRASLNAMQQQMNVTARDWNAVIEREVARRLEKRLNEASATRQALAVAAQQAKLSALQRAPLPLTPDALAAAPFLAAWNQQGSNMSAALNFAAQNLYHNNNRMHAMAAAKARQAAVNYAALGGDTQTLGSLPTTNIQGAKTA